jgi:hypothetical protein
LPLTALAQAPQSNAPQKKHWKLSNSADPNKLKCRYVGAISHRCYSFISDSTWPEGIPGNNYGN